MEEAQDTMFIVHLCTAVNLFPVTQPSLKLNSNENNSFQ